MLQFLLLPYPRELLLMVGLQLSPFQAASGLTGSFSLCYDKEKKSPTPVSAKEVDRMSHTLLKILPLWAGLWQILNGVILIGVLALIVLGCIALWKYIRRT